MSFHNMREFNAEPRASDKSAEFDKVGKEAINNIHLYNSLLFLCRDDMIVVERCRRQEEAKRTRSRIDWVEEECAARLVLSPA